MRILVISTCVPFPPVGGGPLRTYHMLKALAREHAVTLLGFTFDDVPEAPSFPLVAKAIRWRLPPRYAAMQSADEREAAAAAEYLGSVVAEPWFASFYDSCDMAQAVAAELREGCDLVWIEDTDMGLFLPQLPPEMPKVVDLHNVYALMARRAANAAIGEERDVLDREAERTRRFEQRVVEACDLAIVCSDEEARAARELLGAERTCVIPNGVDTAYFQPVNAAERANSLLFTGTMNHPPNAQAVLHLAHEILPLVRRALPGVELHVVGKNAGAEVRALGDVPGVTIYGGVPDMRPHFARAAVVVAPILGGGGTRLKILEAAACAKAIVSTSMGAEGLGLNGGEHLRIAETPAEFAQAVVELLCNRHERRRLGEAARRASLAFDWARIEAAAAAVVPRIAGARGAVPHG